MKYGSKEDIPAEILSVITEVVPEDKVISRYNFRIPLLGHISLFMSTIPGFIVCVLVPLLLLVGYDVLRRRISDGRKMRVNLPSAFIFKVAYIQKKIIISAREFSSTL